MGVSDDMLRGRRFRRLFTGVYVAADTPMSLGIWIHAARLAAPADVVVGSLTGLRMHGVELGPRWPLRFVSASPWPVRRDRIQVARARVLPPARRGTAIAEHCFAAACADLDLLDAVTAGDQLVHLEHATPLSLARSLTGGSRGVCNARRAVALVRERVESPRETYVRLMLVLAGLPEPTCNVNIVTGARFLARGDLVYEAYRLLVEYDGRQHAEIAQQWEHDLDRHDGLSASAWRVVRVTRRRLGNPRAVVRQVHAQLTAAGYRGPAPRFGDEWTRLFEHTTAARRAWVALNGSWD